MSCLILSSYSSLNINAFDAHTCMPLPLASATGGGAMDFLQKQTFLFAPTPKQSFFNHEQRSNSSSQTAGRGTEEFTLQETIGLQLSFGCIFNQSLLHGINTHSDIQTSDRQTDRRRSGLLLYWLKFMLFFGQNDYFFHLQGAQWAANKMWDFSPKNVGI